MDFQRRPFFHVIDDYIYNILLQLHVVTWESFCYFPRLGILKFTDRYAEQKRISLTDPLGHVCCKIMFKKKVKMVINRLIGHLSMSVTLYVAENICFCKLVTLDDEKS